MPQAEDQTILLRTVLFGAARDCRRRCSRRRGRLGCRVGGELHVQFLPERISELLILFLLFLEPELLNEVVLHLIEGILLTGFLSSRRSSMVSELL